MRKIIKIILSIPVFIFYLLALADILNGRELLIGEFIILGLGGIWFVYLIKPFKPPKFLIGFWVFLISVVLHNVIFYLLKFEEPVFFFLSLFSFTTSVILFFTFIIKKVLKVTKKS